MKLYLGIDAGSVSTKLAVTNEDDELIAHVYLLTFGNPVEVAQEGLRRLKTELLAGSDISGVTVTGSARDIVGVVTGADLVKNEITCHAVAALKFMPEVRTVIEIGGQDSKIIIIRDGVVADFGMNTVCAAGTGSFLDHQAQRLNMTIEELSNLAVLSHNPVKISGKCTVFAESDMIHKQQTGNRTEDIVYGLCRALVRNYIASVALGKDIEPPIVFQGGVSFNKGMVRAFQDELKTEVIVPPHPEMMGAIGAAILAREKMSDNGYKTNFRGLEMSEMKFNASSFECMECPSRCEVAEVSQQGRVLARWGGRCKRWEQVIAGNVLSINSKGEKP